MEKTFLSGPPPHRSAARERRGGSIGWVVALVLAGVLLVLAGAWLGRLRVDELPTVLAPIVKLRKEELK